LVAPRLNAAVVQAFLDQLSAAVPAGAHVLLVWDGAGYHVAKALRVLANLTVARLPPYSPELNPVERLWLYLRQHSWSNRVYADIEAVEEAAVSGWQDVCLRPEMVRTICRCEYLPAGSYFLGAVSVAAPPPRQAFSASTYGRIRKPQPAPCWSPTAGAPLRSVGGTPNHRLPWGNTPARCGANGTISSERSWAVASSLRPRPRRLSRGNRLPRRSAGASPA
jgi:transposase